MHYNSYLADAVMISNFYAFNLTDRLRVYIAEHDVTQSTLSDYYRWMLDELKVIQDIQEEHQATINKEIVGLEHVIGKSFIQEVIKITEKDISENHKYFLESFKSTAIAAYKFQLKFCIYNIKNLILDDRYFGKLALH